MSDETNLTNHKTLLIGKAAVIGMSESITISMSIHDNEWSKYVETRIKLHLDVPCYGLAVKISGTEIYVEDVYDLIITVNGLGEIQGLIKALTDIVMKAKQIDGLQYPYKVLEPSECYRQKRVNSREWSIRSKELRERYKYCFSCGSTGSRTDVHHNDESSYDNAHKYLSSRDLMILCSSCHSKLHGELRRYNKPQTIWNRCGPKQIDIEGPGIMTRELARLDYVNCLMRSEIRFLYFVDGTLMYTSIRYYEGQSVDIFEWAYEGSSLNNVITEFFV